MHAPARACGIDFGTSNSTAGWLRPDAAPLLALEDGRPTLPSAVFFNADEDSTHFGRDALAHYLEGYEGRLMLVRLSPERARHDERGDDLLGNAGIHIGGTDFDRALSLDCVMPLLGHRGLMKNGAHIPASLYFQLSTWHTINTAYSRQAWNDFQNIYRDAAERAGLDRLARLLSRREGHWLALQVEQAKVDLSTAATAALDLGRLEDGLRHAITSADFTAATTALVERVGGCVAQLLGDAGIRREQVDTVYFTGGASGVPQLRARIAAELPAARAVEGDLYGSIGAGLAVEAARRYG